jgi:hypothetical protein
MVPGYHRVSSLIFELKKYIPATKLNKLLASNWLLVGVLKTNQEVIWTGLGLGYHGYV